MRFSFLLFLSVLGITCYGQKNPAPQILFSIDDKKVFVDEFEYIFKKNNQHKNEQVSKESVIDYLDLYVNFKLKITEAKQAGLDTTLKFKKEFNSYKADLKKPYLASEDELDRLVKEAYDRLRYEIHALHILILCTPDASPEDTLRAYQKIVEIRGKALDGADFATLAKDSSEDPTAKQNGGDLGYFTAMQMVYPFESRAYETEPGKISQIVRTRFGYHIIKVLESRQARGEVEVSHVLIRSSDKAKQKIFEAYNQLGAGRNWDEVCAEFSEDQNSKNTGGRLRPFGLGGIASVPEFENMAFSMENPGEISDPFSSAIGWHIVRLEKRIPLPSYEEMKEGLKRRITRDERLQISKNNQLNKKKSMFGLEEIGTTKSKVITLADSTLTKGKWRFSGSTELLTEALIKIEKKIVPVKDFVTYIYKNQSTSNVMPDAYMNQLYNQYVESVLDRLEDDMLMAKFPDFRFIMTEYYEGILLFEIMEEKIWNQASADTIGQYNFFELNRKLYSAGERVEARIFSSKDQSELTELRRRIMADSLSLKDLKSIRAMSVNRYQSGESSIVDSVPWEVGIHECEKEGMYYIVEIQSLVGPGLQEFDEIRATIISDYQDYLEKEWVKELKSKHVVKINNKGKTAVLKKLVEK